jgi:hypothetical protein
MFSGSFTVSGVTLNNITTTHEFSRPVGEDALMAGFRMIPLDEIDLLEEIRLEDETYIVKRGGQRPHLRRIYAAKIEGRKSCLTVALYQGDGAEEVWYIKLLPVFSDLPAQNWRGDVERHSIVRHPSFVQFQGLARSSKTMIWAIIFDDGTSLIYCKMSNV